MPQFQPPSFVNPRPYDDIATPGSMDAIFEAYQRAKLGERQQLMQNVELARQGINPQDIQNDPGAIYNRLIEQHKAARVQKSWGESLESARAVAEIGKLNAEADKLRNQPRGPDLDAMAADLAGGKLAPSQLPSLLGRGSGNTRVDLFNRAKNLNPSFDAVQAEREYRANLTGAEAGARLSGGGSSQVVARTAQSALEQMDILENISREFPRSDVKFMNTAINRLSGQYSSQAQRWLTAVNSVRYEYATALARGNKPGEEDIKDAKVALPDNITPQQLVAVVPVLRQMLAATVRGQMTSAPAGQALGAQPGPNRAPQNDPLGLFR